MTEVKSTKPSTPHDKFYKQALDNIKVAQELFNNFLPEHVRQLIDLSTLKPAKDTFSDPALGNSAADAVFSVKYAGQDGYLILHGEHQSKCERFMVLRLRKYQNLIHDQYHKNNPESNHLPLIYSMVYYTGIGKYTAPLDFFELFENPELARKLVNEPHKLIDLQRLTDEDIDKAIWVGSMMRAMKFVKLDDIAPYLKDIMNMLKVIAEENSLYIEAIFAYIINQADTDEVNKVVETFQEVVKPEDREAIMTIAERLIQQGKLEGKLEGELIKAQEIATNMLNENQDINLIAKFTGLSLAAIRELESKVTRH